MTFPRWKIYWALQIANIFACPPENCLIIGDSTIDLETAANAGMSAIAVSWGYHDRDRLIAAGADRITHLWSYKFSLKANRSDVGNLKKIEVMLWMATEEEYLKTIQEKGKGGIIPSIKHVRLDVQLLDDRNDDEAPPDSAGNPPVAPSQAAPQQAPVPHTPDARPNPGSPASGP